MSNMRGLDTQVRAIRRRVFKEVAKLGFEANSETLLEDMEAIPYEIVNDEMCIRDSFIRPVFIRFKRDRTEFRGVWKE